MTGWDVLNNIVTGGFPFAVTALFTIAAFIALIIFIVGFAKHGVDFIKHGFTQKGISDLAKKIDNLEAKMDERFAQIDAKIIAIETNHFGHLKDFLTELTSILLDKSVINNAEKTRLDNQLHGM